MTKENLQRFFDDLTLPDAENAAAPCIAAAVRKNGALRFSYARAVPHDPTYGAFSEDTLLFADGITKTIFAVLLTQLAAEGQITRLTPVGEFLPEEACKGTVLDLLEQTDFTTLDRIMEAVTGEPVELYAAEHLFTPLSMRHTTFDLRTLPARAVIMPYDRDTDTYRTPNDFPANSGFLFTTANDLLRMTDEIGNILHSRKNTGILAPWDAASLLRPLYGCRTPAFFRRGDGTAAYFPDCASPDACIQIGSGGILLMDPTYDISLAILSGAGTLSREPLLLARCAAVLYGACLES